MTIQSYRCQSEARSPGCDYRVLFKLQTSVTPGKDENCFFARALSQACGVKPGDGGAGTKFYFLCFLASDHLFGGYACVCGFGGGYLEYESCVIGKGY